MNIYIGDKTYVNAGFGNQLVESTVKAHYDNNGNAHIVPAKPSWLR